MIQYISKDALVAEIERKRGICKKVIWDLRSQENKDYYQGKAEAYKDTLDLLDTLEVKEVDLDVLGVLAEHLIACDAHGITPKYRDEEWDILEGLANNKAQKGEL